MIIAFIGLPSAGKTTMINSLIGKRSLQTGICRTTIEPTFIGVENTLNFDNYIHLCVESDDRHLFSIIDLPGICDIEDTDNTFNDITEKHIVSADVVLWLTSSETAFLTDNEKNQFLKIKKIIQKYMLENNRVIQTGIVMTKSNCSNVNMTEQSSESESDTELDSDELSGSEDTTINDSINRVRTHFPNEYVINYNAFGRIIHKGGCSQKFKKFVRKMDRNPTNNNIKFNIGHFVNNILSMEDQLNIDIFNKWYRENSGTGHGITAIPFDFAKMFTTEGDETFDQTLFESFMRKLICCKEYNYRGFNLYICSLFGEQISRYIDQCNIGLYKYKVRINMNDYNNGQMWYMLKLIELTEGVDSLRYKHMYMTYITLARKGILRDQLSKSEKRLMRGCRSSYETVTIQIEHTYYDSSCQVIKFNYGKGNETSLDIDLNADNTIACNNQLLNDVREQRKELYPNEDVNIEMIIVMKLRGELLSIMENFNLDYSVNEDTLTPIYPTL